METLFSWIHLSDLHFGHGDVAYQSEQKLVLHELAKDLRAQLTQIRNVLKVPDWWPDALIVSGDVAYSANARSASEYSDAYQWIDSVARDMHVPPPHVLLVPGNHDIRRLEKSHDTDAYRLLNNLRKGVEHLDDALSQPADRERLLARATDFLEFAATVNPIHAGLRSEQCSFCWKQEFVRSGVCTRVIGFNTAFLCNDDRDSKQLTMGTKPLAAAFAGHLQGHADIVVTVTHHPFEWLRDEEVAKNWITSHSQIHLCGHIHEQKAESFRSGGADPFLRVVAGASHNDDTSQAIGSHGYNIGLLLRSESKVVARVWPRTWVDKHKCFKLDIANADDRLGYTDHSLEVKLPKSDTPSGAEPSVASNAASHPQSLSVIVVVIVNIPPGRVEELRVPGTEIYSSFIPGSGRLCRINAPSTSGFIDPNRFIDPSRPDTSYRRRRAGKWEEAKKSVYVVHDPVRPFEVQIGELRASRPGGDPGTVPLVDGLTPESLRIMYPIMVDESLRWLRMIFADLSTSAEVLNEIYDKDPDPEIKEMAARNPSASNHLKATVCPFCDSDFLKTRMKRFGEGVEKSEIVRQFRNRTKIICNDYPYGPLFHYIVMPHAPIHSWEDIEENHLRDMNLLIWEFFNEDPARLNGAAGIRIGLNSTIRHLVMGKGHRTSAGASVAHVHKQIWGMLPGSINLGDHLRQICHSFGTQEPAVDYLARYLDALCAADLVLWKDLHGLVTLYVPFGQTSLHELQIMVNRPGVGNYLELTREEVIALSQAEFIVTRLYQMMGIQSFNEVMLTQRFETKEPQVRLVLTFITREVDIAVSELNLLYVVDKFPENTRDEARPLLKKILADLDRS